MDHPRTWSWAWLTVPLLVLLSFFAGYVVGERAELRLSPPFLVRSADLVNEAARVIREHYDGEVDLEKVRSGGIDGMIRALDEYGEYFTAEEWKRFEEDALKGEFGGIGVVIQEDAASGYLQVVSTLAGTPAGRADLLPGDLLREVDGRSLRHIGRDKASRWVRGPVGSEVTLTVSRKEAEPFSVKLRREIIVVPAVLSGMADREKGVGYIRIVQFSKLMDEFEAQVAALEREGMKALILDLRFNGGGLLDESVQLSDFFLEEGDIVRVEGRAVGAPRVERAKPGGRDFPLVVLVNEMSASASEVFAGAMRDHARGTLVGARTYGKGTVQTTFALWDESRLKVTTARYLTPKGESVHRIKGKKEYGLDPDVRIDTTEEEAGAIARHFRDQRYQMKENGTAADPQLEAALEIARARIEGREPHVTPRILDPKPAPEAEKP